MLAPSRAARSAMASPIPRDAPVMNSVLPASDMSGLHMGSGAVAGRLCAVIVGETIGAGKIGHMQRTARMAHDVGIGEQRGGGAAGVIRALLGLLAEARIAGALGAYEAGRQGE